LKEILPGLDAPFDLIVLVAEIEELFDLAKSFRRLVKALSYVPKNLGEAAKLLRNKGNTRTSKVKVAADRHLWKNFSLKPALRDAYNLVESFCTLGDRLYALRRGAGLDKMHKAHGGFRDRPEVGKVWCEDVRRCGGPCMYVAQNIDECSSRLYDSFHEVKGGLTVLYSYELPNDFDKFWGAYSAALQTLGGSVSLKTGWDLIPFSFVADWIFPIGDWLETVKMDAFPVKIVIHDLCISLRHRRRGLVKDNGYCFTNFREITTGSIYAERYTRKAYREALPHVFSARLPSAYQVSLGAALVSSIGEGSVTELSRGLKRIKRLRKAK
jgi:hypothetical protein